ncbi:hydroxyacid dehydrogenase [Candidatus Woesearchaeota archaeon]|nr:hydroxyacid dehydrogenase [Candidatus Woesearchaeota archaeon]
MQLTFFEIEDWEKEFFKNNLKNHKLLFYKHELKKKNIDAIKNCNGLIVFIYSKINKEILSKLPKLKFIATMSTGYDHIDIEECKKRNIAVFNVPFYGENTVAEHTFALILALSRKIHLSYDRTRVGNFSLENLRGFDLKGKTLGIIGTGHIGQHVARIAKGFEIKVLAFDVYQDKKLAKTLGFSYTSLANLLKKSDIITLHAPYNKNTHHLLNAKNFQLIKKGAYIINTARGALIETEALVKALQQKKIAGAALDVLEGECYIREEKELLKHKKDPNCDLKTIVEDQMLLHMDNVIITPHNAFNSQEALQRIIDTTLENIHCFIKKKKCKDRVA